MNPEEINQNQVPPLQNTKPIPPQKTDNEFFITPLRTYQEDVKNAIQKNNISTAKIMMAEQQRRQREASLTEETDIKSKTNVIRITVSLFLILAGIGLIGGSVYYWYSNKPANLAPIASQQVSKIIDVDETVEVSTANKTNREVIGLIREQIRNFDSAQKLEAVKEIRPTKIVVSREENREVTSKVDLNTVEFFQLIESRAPDGLIRSLDSSFMLGVHKTGELAEPFIIFTSNDYENSYANMLAWERNLIVDVRDIFYRKLGSSQAFIGESAGWEVFDEEISYLNIEEADQNGEMLQQDEPQNTVINYNNPTYTDLIINNRDVRAVFDENENILFFYSFVDKKHLVLTDNVETFNALINKINSVRLIR